MKQVFRYYFSSLFFIAGQLNAAAQTIPVSNDTLEAPYWMDIYAIKTFSRPDWSSSILFWKPYSGQGISIVKEINKNVNWDLERSGFPYSEQLTELAALDSTKNLTVFFYSHYLNYIYNISEIENKEIVALDSIPEAEGIHDLAPNSSGARFASIENGKKTYLVRKAADGKWVTVPVIYSAQPDKKTTAIFFCA